MEETWVQSLGQEDLLEKGMATHSSVLVWKTPWTEELGRLQSKGLSRVFSNTTVQKHQFLGTQLSSQSTLNSIHDHWKNNSLE